MNIKKNIKRLFDYHSTLKKLQKNGVRQVFSSDIGEETAVSAAQVRKDFSSFRISKGKRKAGYNIVELLGTLEQILHSNRQKPVILIGLGNIGKALANFKGFNMDNIKIKAVFDSDPHKQPSYGTLPVLNPDKMPAFIKKNEIDTAILAVPEDAAQATADILTKNGIKGILNFTPAVLKTKREVVVNNVNLGNELKSIIYYVKK